MQLIWVSLGELCGLFACVRNGQREREREPVGWCRFCFLFLHLKNQKSIILHVCALFSTTLCASCDSCIIYWDTHRRRRKKKYWIKRRLKIEKERNRAKINSAQRTERKRMKQSIKQEIQLKCFLKVIFCNVEEMMFHTVIESDAMYARLRIMRAFYALSLSGHRRTLVAWKRVKTRRIPVWIAKVDLKLIN